MHDISAAHAQQQQSHVVGAHSSRYDVTIQDHAGAVRGAGVASVPRRLRDG